MSRRIRVLVVDDSEAVRGAFAAMLGAEPDLEVVGFAADGEQAVVETERLHPDIVTLDMQMPRMNGLEAIEQIMSRCPSRILVVCAASDPSEVNLSMRAVAAGALELLAKPGPEDDASRFCARLCESVRLMAEIPLVRRRRRDGSDEERPGSVAIIGVVASTGGPPALGTLFNRLGPELPIPVVVAQHLVHGFTPGLIRWLSQTTPLTVQVACEGLQAQPGAIYFAPDGMDLEVECGARLRVRERSERFAPSGDRLLASLASSFGPRAGGVVMSGMGEDGARGLLAIREAGGVTFAQDEQTCTVFGMPEASRRLGATHTLLPPTAIAQALRRLAVPLIWKETGS